MGIVWRRDSRRDAEGREKIIIPASLRLLAWGLGEVSFSKEGKLPVESDLSIANKAKSGYF
jgi:hypothetical protein